MHFVGMSMSEENLTIVLNVLSPVDNLMDYTALWEIHFHRKVGDEARRDVHFSVWVNRVGVNRRELL